MVNDDVLFDGDTDYAHYQVVDTVYSGRKSRLLYSGNHQAAQSGLALDDKDELLFDYNERFMELARGIKPASLLLIGGGALTLPKALIEYFPQLHIDVVELDGQLLEIAEAFFDFKPSATTRIFTDHGRHFLDNTKTAYDLIIVDAFNHTEVPPELQTVEAMQSICDHLNPHGVMAMNIIAAFHGLRSAVLRRQLAACHEIFPTIALFPAGSAPSKWLPENYILTAQMGSQDLQPYMRYHAANLPAIGPADVTYDD